MEPKKLFESLFIFHKCNLSLLEAGGILQRVDSSNNEFTREHLSITNTIILEAVSFIDEYEQNFYHRCEKEYKDKVVLSRKLCAPILKQIKKWSDLKEFRNHIIAHPWRNSKKEFIIPDFNLYNVPFNWFEHAVLVNLIHYMFQVIISVFPNEYRNMFNYMEKLVPKSKVHFDPDEYNKEHLRMALEVNQIAKCSDHNFELKILGYSIK